MKIIKLLLVSVFLIFLINKVSAQTVNVGGDVEKPFVITTAWFQKAKQVTVKGTGHDNKPHQYTGILLNDILNEAGALPGGKLHGKALAKYVVVKAGDGYKAVIALPEVNPEFNDKNIILANKVDGKPLPEKTGPFQIIIPGEKKWGRWVRQVTDIVVQTVKD